nr:hypothetical protein GCM10025699_23060 [Microbacterium flavescens]
MGRRGLGEDVSRILGTRSSALVAAAVGWAVVVAGGWVVLATSASASEAAQVAPRTAPVSAESPPLLLPDGAHLLPYAEDRWDAASLEVVRSEPPSVDVVATRADEGGIARVRAIVSDPDDVRAAQIDWGDGTPAQHVTVAELAAGVDHGYGDDGSFPVTVTVTDAEGRVGAHAVLLEIVGLAPAVTLDVSGTVAFPGGEYVVSAPGVAVTVTAEAIDPGSDDLSFAWSNGRSTTFHAAEGAADPSLSPLGTFPVEAEDTADHTFAAPGVETVRVAVTDDDGRITDASTAVVVTGSAPTARPTTWWIREYAGLDPSVRVPAVSAAYLDIVQAVSTVFSELEPVTTPAEVVDVLAARDGDARAQARAGLLHAWLVFAAGAVSPAATVTLSSGGETSFLGLMADAETVVSSAGSTDAELAAVLDDLRRVSG